MTTPKGWIYRKKKSYNNDNDTTNSQMNHPEAAMDNLRITGIEKANLNICVRGKNPV